MAGEEILVCPRTGEVCEWRKVCAEGRDEWSQLNDKARQAAEGGWGTLEKVVASIMPVILRSSRSFAQIYSSTSSRVAERDAILALNCIGDGDEGCIVYDAMVAQHIIDPQEQGNIERHSEA